MFGFFFSAGMCSNMENKFSFVVAWYTPVALVLALPRRQICTRSISHVDTHVCKVFFLKMTCPTALNCPILMAEEMNNTHTSYNHSPLQLTLRQRLLADTWLLLRLRHPVCLQLQGQ
jgi:hypothetical protein